MNNFASGVGTDPRTTNTLGFDGIYGGASGVFNELTDRNTDMGFNNWAAIRRCNQIITKVGKSAEISANDKTALMRKVSSSVPCLIMLWQGASEGSCGSIACWLLKMTCVCPSRPILRSSMPILSKIWKMPLQDYLQPK